MLSEPRWLKPDEVVELNQAIVADTGEPYLLRDAGLLAGAVARPFNHYQYDGETDVVRLAVTLLFAIAESHPFQQGNKRTGFEAAVLFLAVNGYEAALPDLEVVAQLIIDVIDHKVDAELFYILLDEFTREIEDDESEQVS